MSYLKQELPATEIFYMLSVVNKIKHRTEELNQAQINLTKIAINHINTIETVTK